jgi:hypothetical protein
MNRKLLSLSFLFNRYYCLQSVLEKRKLFVLVILFLGVYYCNAQSWEHNYGYFGTPDAGDQVNCVIQTSDGGYAAAGFTSSWGAGGKDIYIVKTDSAGKMVWQQVIGGAGDEFAYGIVQNSNGEYYAAGYTNSFGAGNIDVYLIKLNSSGDILWTKTYGGNQADNAKAILLTSTGDIVLAGATASFGAGSNDIYLLKVDSSGNLLWSKTIGRSSNDYATAISLVHDGGFILGGYTDGYGANNGYVVRTDSTGDTLWTASYEIGNYSTREIRGVKESANNSGFLFCGVGLRYGSGYFSHLFYISAGLSGNFIYRRTTGLISDDGNGIDVTSDGGFATTGYLDNYGQSAQLIKYDSLGTIQWYKEYERITSGSYPFYSEGCAVKQTSDGGYIIGGRTFFSGQQDALLIKTDANGNGQVYPTINITAGGPTTFCTGGSVTLTAPPGYLTYKWLIHAGNNLSWIGGADSVTYNATQAGTYFCSMSDSFGIYHSTGIALAVVPFPTASVTPTYANFCAAVGSSTTLTSNSVSYATYQWQLNGSPIPGATSTTYSTAASGTYNMIITTTCGTATSNNVVVNAGYISAPYVSWANNLYGYYGIPSPCNSIALSFNAVTGATYQWYFNGNPMSGETNTYLYVYQQGNYYASITNACGTTNTMTNNIPLYNQSPTISAGGPISGCNVTSVNMTFQDGSSYRQWLLNGNPISGATSYSYTATVSGIYSVYFLADGCPSQYFTSPGLAVTINSTPFPSISAGGNTTLCNSDSVLLSASVSGGTYQWKRNNVNIAGATLQNYYASQSGSYTCVITTSSCGTNTSNSLAVWAGLPAGTANASANPICFGNSSTLSVSSSTLNLLYQWRLNGSNIGGATNSTYSATQAGNYDCILTNTCGSIIINIITLIVKPIPIANITPSGNLNLCPAQNIILTADTGTGYSYQWKKNNVNISGAVFSTYTANSSGSYAVNMTLNGCSVLSSATILTSVINPVANIWPSTPAQFCGADSVRLNANTGNGYSYQWYRNNILVNGATQSFYYADLFANYSVNITNSNGCSALSAPIPVTMVNGNIPNANITSLNIDLCPGDSILLSAFYDSTYSYQWQLNSQNILGATASVFSASTGGNYSCLVSVVCGSALSNIITLILNPISNISISAGTSIICSGDSIEFTATTDTSFFYQWQLNGVNIAGAVFSDYYANTIGNYNCIITNNCGASSTNVIALTQGPSIPSLPSPVSGLHRPCPNTTSVHYFINPVSGATSYTWTVPPTASISSGQGTTSIYVDFSTSFISGNITVSASNICGNGPVRSRHVGPNLMCIPPVNTRPVVNLDAESEDDFDILIYPNPTSGILTLETNSNNLLEKVIVYSVDARVIKSLVIGHSEQTSVDLKELASGIYFLDCVSEGGSQRIKVVKY